MKNLHLGRGARPTEMLVRCCLVAAALAAAGPVRLAAQPAAKPEVYVIPHTHWEGAVFKTREEYLEMGLPHIEKALYLLKKYPDYRFVLDQMCYVKPFLERYPQEEAAFRKFLGEGRLQLAGGTDSMHDNNMPSGESIARQYLLSKQFFRERLGYDVTTGWGLDTFGHNAQMPQILKLAGMQSYWFQRGVASVDTPSEFMWKGIDGTVVPAFWLPISYGPLHNIPSVLPEFDRMLRGQFARLDRFSRGGERVLMAGADVWEPEENLPLMVEAFNRASGSPYTVKLAVPRDFEQAVGKRTDRPVIEGELNPVFQGIYSTRIDVKQALRQSERMLETAERLGVIANWMGGHSGREMQERAWEPVLFNQAHDLASGVMVDKVYEDSMMGYNHAQRLAGEMVNESLATINARINTSGDGVPVIVFNTLGWVRTDIAETNVAFSEAGVREFGVVDGAGKAVPVQVLNALRNQDGGLRQVRIAFIARDVPAMGYAVYRAVPNVRPGGAATGGGAQEDHSSWHEDRGTIENEYYRATFNLWNGDLTSLVLKENNWEVLSAPANVAREYDGGDFWELYGTLNGARLTAMKKEIPAPRPAYTQSSSEFVGGSGATHGGPVFSEFRITHPLGKNQFSTNVRLYHGLRRIDISTQILNQEEFVRYRALFPTTIRKGKSVHEIPFGAIERPEKAEFPAQNWTDYGDGEKGVTLLNLGMPGNNVADGMLMLSLMRSTRLISYGFIGGLEPGVGSDSALGIGKRYTLNYGLIPHRGAWRDALPWRAGMELNRPLLAYTAAKHSGDLPPRWGLLEVSGDGVVVSAMKPSREGDVALRIYEASGRPSPGVNIRFDADVTAVRESNLIEDAGGAVTAQNGRWTCDLKPYEIKTFRLRLAPRRPKEVAQRRAPTRGERE